MPETRPTPTASTRTALAGISALLVVGVILGTTLAAVEPGFREPGRESYRNLTPARQFKVSLAKAVRRLVGGDHLRPAISLRSASAARAECEAPWGSIAGEQSRPRALTQVRLALLNLPPPAPLA